MKIPYGWIREFVDLELTAEQAAEKLVNAGIEVASVTPVAANLSGVVIGQIEAIERELGDSHGHRLVLCRVSTGRQRFQVVCGAPNARAGVRAAFAPPGAVLPGGRAVSAARIRGVESQGMLCSERELGLGEAHESGILLLDEDAPLGEDLIRHLRLDDRVLEIEITPNRPDCLSVVGVARELAALTGSRFHLPEFQAKEGAETASDLAKVRINATDLCARFTGRVISGVRVGPSPAWLAARLRAVGLRPISNVVDVTNYVMWELGHPLHAFDWGTLTDATIVVRRAGAGERFTTLDGQTRTLTDRMLVIADPRRAVGLAGVMGGANTEVTAATTRVFLEAAWFQPGSVRRTARTLGLLTDAAYRFERTADIEALPDANTRAAQLIADLSGGVVARGIIDVYPDPRPRRRVPLRMERVQRVLGIAPPRAEARRMLVSLGLDVRDRADDFEVEVPAFRRDIAIEDDLVEEVIRVWGYDRIPSTLPGGAISLVQRPATLRQSEVARRALAGAGLNEIVTYSFSDPDLAQALLPEGATPPPALLNPMSREASWLRSNPLEGVLSVVATNVRWQQTAVRIFEIGKVFERAPGLPSERRWLSVALTGSRRDAAWWSSDGGGQVDVYDAKGLAEHVLDALGVRAPVTRETAVGDVKGFEPDCHGVLVAPGGVAVADFGEVSAEVRARFGIPVPVFAAVLSLDEVLRLTPPVVQYQPLPRHPAVQRDLAFVAGRDQAVSAAAVEAAVAEEAGPLLRELALFDVFTFEDGRRNLAWRLTFQADDRTLRDDDVNEIQQRVARRIERQFSLTWRSA